MPRYLDDKIDELMEISMKIKRYVQHQCAYVDGASIFQLETLIYINKNPKITMKELADHLNISMSSATQLIERLANNKYVERLLDPNDRRIIRLNISKEGVEEIGNTREKMREAFKRLYQPLTEKELEDYIRITTKIISSM